MLAAGLAALEILAVADLRPSTFTLVLFALLAVAAYYSSPGASCRAGALREGAWIVAFAQGLLALVVVAIPVTVFFVFLLAVVVLLVHADAAARRAQPRVERRRGRRVHGNSPVGRGQAVRQRALVP